MSDLISRQAVTKFLNDWLSCLFENCHKQSASDLKMIIKDFKNLPSVQPETNCSEIPNNSDTISRQAAIDALLGITAMRNTIPLDSAIFNIKKLPSAQPEIIHCKDCKWYGRADKRRFYRGMDCLQKRIDTIVPDRDFCSRAERREE